MGTITQAIANNLTTGLGGAGGVNFRNIIINGDMSIAQRGTSATGIGNEDTGYHTLDRWKFFEADSPSYEFTMSQSTDVPTGQGFATSLKMDCTTAEATLAAADLSFLEHYIEGQNVQYLKKGTANAEYVTASFWVKSTKTGTFIVELIDLDNSRFTNFNYTVDVSDTWEKKTVSFVPDTTGTLDNNNAASLCFRFGLLAGTTFSSGSPSPTTWLANSGNNSKRAANQVNIADNTANNFLITGIQLEAGTSASDFEFLPVDVNLARCQRYYQIIADRTSTGDRMAITCGAAIVTGSGASVVYAAIQFPTPMRASATMLSTTVTNGYRLLGDTQPTFNVMSASPITNRGARITNGGTVSSTVTSGKAYLLECELNGSNLMFSSEL